MTAKFKVGDVVTRNDVEVPDYKSSRERLRDRFAGVGEAMVNRMPARVLKVQEFDGGQSVYLDIVGFETVSFNSKYLRIAN